jgi:hypothetical protein
MQPQTSFKKDEEEDMQSVMYIPKSPMHMHIHPDNASLQIINCYCKEFDRINSDKYQNLEKEDEDQINMKRNIGRVNLVFSIGYNFCSDSCEILATNALKEFAIKCYFIPLTAEFVSTLFPQTICIERNSGKIDRGWQICIPGITKVDLSFMQSYISTKSFQNIELFGFEDQLFGDIIIPCEMDKNNKGVLHKYVKLSNIVKVNPELNLGSIKKKYQKYVSSYWNNSDNKLKRYLFFDK